MRVRVVAVALLAATLALGAARPAAAASIDPLLLPVLSGQAAPQVLGGAMVGAAPDGTGELRLSISIRFSGSVDVLRALGIRVEGVIGDIATAEVTLSQIRVLASHPAVQTIEAARTLSPQLDASAPSTGLFTFGKDVIPTGVTPLRSLTSDNGVIGWTNTSLTGRGVLIGIIDTGIDFTHDDFLKPDGTTRLVAVWDQSTAVGRSPRGFSYGAECTAEQINARDCPLVDRNGHGTHVAGIAAGDGSATSGDQNAYRFIGMAPEADLLVVKTNLATTRVIDALDYLKTKAAALQKPIVINMSFGTTLGPHDGTLNLDRAVDNFTKRDDESRPPDEDNRPGGVAVVSAGNDGQTAAGNPLHAVGCFQTGSPAPACPTGITALSGATPAIVSFVIPGNTTTVYLDLWYPGTAALGVAVTEPAACATPKASLTGNTVVTASTSCGTIVIGAGGVYAPNGDRWSVVTLTSGSSLASGIWSLAITGDDLPASGATRFDVWSTAIPSNNKVVFNTLGNPETTITSPASAANAVAVVAYISKPSSVFFNGSCIPAPASNNLSPVSSRGPLRPCTTCAPQTQKPDLAAPGLMIMSSLSSRVPDDDLFCQLDPDRRHYGLEGSSMAAPHVAGAAALLLQLNRNLTVAQIKTYLLDNVSAPAVPLPHPVEQWGQGRLNVRAAVVALRAAGDDPAPAVPSGLRVTSVHSHRVALTWDHNPDLDLRIYRVFRRDETGLASVLVQEIPPTVTAIEDVDNSLINETAYMYTVQAVDISNVSSGDSAEVRAVPTAGDGSTGLCFIATAAYGSAWHPHVASLRAFRDRHLRPYAAGRGAVAAYEAISPPIARFIAPHPWFRAGVRGMLTPIVLALEHPRASAAFVGLGVLGVIGLGLRRRAG